MKIETRYISGRQADTKTVLFGKAMELPVCFYGEEGIVIIPPYEDRKKIETELERRQQEMLWQQGSPWI